MKILSNQIDQTGKLQLLQVQIAGQQTGDWNQVKNQLKS